MTRLFANRITEEGNQAMQDLIDQVAQDLNQTIRTHGADSIEAAGLGQILATIHFVKGEYRRADPLIRNYVFTAEEQYGSNSDEVLCGLILFANNCIGWERLEESRFVLERVKYVFQRCSSLRDPLLEGLCDAAVRYRDVGDPDNEQRSFILSLLALSWCVRYPTGHNYPEVVPEVEVAGYHEIYAQYIQQLKPAFETYGFVEERWDWLIGHCNHNLHDLVGLISILLEKRIFPMGARPPLTAEMREECLRLLAQEFPVCREGGLKERILEAGGHPMKLEFMCPLCGSRDLRTKLLEPHYPISTLDRIRVDPSDIDICDLQEREPSEYWPEDQCDGWEFWCDKCGLEPKLDRYDDDESSEESLARWLLDNCPQNQGMPATEDSPLEGDRQ